VAGAKPNELTARQREVLSTMARYWGATGRMPTYRETAALVGFASWTGVICHLDALSKKGYVRLVRHGTSNTITAVEIPGLTDQVKGLADAYIATLAAAPGAAP
jgi:repressor LexA